MNSYPDELRLIWGHPIILEWPNSLRDNMGYSLLWNQKTPGRRRAEFPSWSWAGWEGPVKEPAVSQENSYGLSGPSEFNQSTPVIQIELNNGLLVKSIGILDPIEWCEYISNVVRRLFRLRVNSSAWFPLRVSHFLHVEADTAKVQIVPSEEVLGDGLKGTRFYHKWAAVLLRSDEECRPSELTAYGLPRYRPCEYLIENEALCPGDEGHDLFASRTTWHCIVLAIMEYPITEKKKKWKPLPTKSICWWSKKRRKIGREWARCLYMLVDRKDLGQKCT